MTRILFPTYDESSLPWNQNAALEKKDDENEKFWLVTTMSSTLRLYQHYFLHLPPSFSYVLLSNFGQMQKLFQTPKTRLSLVGVVSLLLLLDALAALLETELLGVRLLGGLLPLGEVSLVGLGVRRVFTDLLVSLSVHVLDVLRRDVVSEPP